MMSYLKIFNTGMLTGAVIFIVSLGMMQNVEAGFFDKLNKLIDDVDTALDDTKADMGEKLSKVNNEVDKGKETINHLEGTKQNIKDAGDSLKVKAKNIEANAKGEIVNSEEVKSGEAKVQETKLHNK